MLKQRGITLIELMIAVAIVGILSAIAFPAYDNYVKRSKRVTAEGDLYAFRNAMQRYFSENNSYLGAAASGADTGIPEGTTFPSQSPIDGGAAAYNLTISAATASAFTVTATALGEQANDGCGNLTLNSANVRTASAGTVDNCWR